MDKQNNQSKAWLGIVLVIVGLAFLTDNLDFFHFQIPHFIFSWKMLFIIIGGSMLVTGRRSGLIFLLIGGFFLIPDIFGWSRLYVRDWWPLILVVVGLSMLFKRSRLNGIDTSNLKGGSDFDVVSVLSGRKHVVDGEVFEGGKVTSVFGGSDIDLTKTNLGPGPAVIDTLVMFGGSTLIVPNDWKVQNEVTCILGGFSDSRRLAAEDTVNPKKVLIIKGFIMCGGGEIKSA